MSAVNTIGLQRPVIQVGGNELDSAQYDALLDLHIESGIRSIARSVLRIADPGYKLSKLASFGALDAACVIKDTDGNTYFDGQIVERAVSHNEHEDTVLELVALDRAHLLARRTHVEARQSSKLSDMIEKLAITQGLTARVPASPTMVDWAAMTGTAASIIDEVAERYGYDWMVRSKTLHVWSASNGSPDESQPVPLKLGADLMEFGLRVSNTRHREVEVRGWDAANWQMLKAKASTKNDRASARFLPKPDGHPPLVQRTDLAPVTQEDAQSLADGAVPTSDRTIARGRGFLNAAIIPGATVAVSQAGVSSGKFYVREVEHHFSTTGGWTRFVAGERDAPRLAEPWPAPQRASTFTHTGAMIGIVTEIHGTEASVKVKLPAFGDQFGSGWARVVMLGAGDKTGLFVMPEINDEVLVVFAEGSLEAPIVIGGLHSRHKAHLAPDTPTARHGKNVVARTWYSRLGHYVELRDNTAPEQQHVKIGLGNGEQFVRVGKDKVEISAPNNVPIRIGNQNAWIEIGQNGAITIQATSVTIKTTQSLQAEGLEISLKAKANVKVEAQATLGLKSGASASLESSGQTVVKGALVQIN